MDRQTPATVKSSRRGYWDDYYHRVAQRPATRPLPSQFAAFVAGELAAPRRVIEFGCGNGRDALFFASRGHHVVGVDESVEAITSCRKLAAELGESAEFVASTVDAPDLVTGIGRVSGPTLVYARFFVHAITDAEEEALLDAAAAITGPGDCLAAEYRTVRDSQGAKVTGAHYRRFVTPANFQARALARGFEVTYSVEGFGFAKYQDDDAYVARDLLTRR